MKILHVVRRLDAAWGGVPAAAAHLASALASKGHEVTIATTVAPAGGEEEVEQLTSTLWDTVTVVCFPRTRLPYDHSRELDAWLRTHTADYDFVEVHGVFDFPCWRGAVAARRASRPYIVHPHSQLDPFDLRKHPIQKKVVGRLVVRKVLDGASCIMVTTRREGAELNGFGSSTSVHDCALPYRAVPHSPDAGRFRAKYRVPDGPIVLFLGRVDYKKGLKHLVDAAEVLSTRTVTPTIVIGGGTSSAFASDLCKSVVRRQLDGVVRFVGHLDEGDKVDALAAASLFVLVSDNENYGLVLVEAARAGLPMIISSEVYLEQELSAAGCAMVVDRNGASIAEAVEALLGDARRLSAMSDAARRTATELFGWEALATAQSQFREALVRSDGPSSSVV